MSLDLAVLSMEIEEEFGVTFVRAEVPIGTVGEVYEYILNWRQIALDGICLSGAIFYRVRRALCRQLGLAPRQVRPESYLEELIPMQDRRRHWDRFRGEVMPFALPDLERKRWLRYALTATGGATLLLGVPVLMGLGCRLEHAVVLLLGAVGLRSLLLLWLTRPLAVCIPEGCGTMRAMIHRVLEGDRDRAHAGLRRLSEQDVWDRLCTVIVENLAVNREQLKPETRFKDLGVD
jgi:acyl carrier protein